MFRNTLSRGIVLLLTAAALLAAPSVSLAQRGGRGGAGFHGGGFHTGGFRPGGFGPTIRSGGFHPGFQRVFHEHDFHHDGFRGYYPYRHFYGFYGGSYPYYGGYGYGAIFPYYAPYYGAYPYYPNFGSGYDNSYLPDYYGSASHPYGSYGNGSTLPEANANSAVVRVHVPLALTDVAFDGKLTTTTGKDRVYTTPELKPGKTYTYTVTANWTEGGVPHNEVRTVQVRAGESSTLDFSKKQ